MFFFFLIGVNVYKSGEFSLRDTNFQFLWKKTGHADLPCQMEAEFGSCDGQDQCSRVTHWPHWSAALSGLPAGIVTPVGGVSHGSGRLNISSMLLGRKSAKLMADFFCYPNKYGWE